MERDQAITEGGEVRVSRDSQDCQEPTKHFKLISHHVHQPASVVGQDVVLGGLLDAEMLSTSINDIGRGMNLQEARLPVKGGLKRYI